MNASNTPTDFIRAAVEEDNHTNRFNGRVQTRFPPEPNGYLHIGHAKAISIDFGIAEDYNGICSLRFDDTNPTKEDVEYVDAIKFDIRWLGFDWDEREFYASDYFDQLYEFALILIKKEKAYVDDLSADEIREYRGTLTEPGRVSPFRNRSIAENLDLFERMKQGEFPDGSRVLRAKINMASGNINMRDPVMYRILHTPSHHRTGSKWCIYPMYDYAHGQSDSIEGVTHSLCSLEYEAHRPLYDWFLDELEIYHPRQIEFARLNLSFTVMSKRRLIRLVQEGFVKGWDDPRMPTIHGLRRRGFTRASIRNFLDLVGVAKNDSIIDIALLEHCLRNDLNKIATRKMAVLRPIKVIIDNFPEGLVEELDAINNPEDPQAGSRKILFTKELYIEQEDFCEVPPPKYYRLFPGNEVRLRYGYFITCTSVVKDPNTGQILEIHCTYDPTTRGGDAQDGRKVKSTIHWVSATHSLAAEVRLYDRLFLTEDPFELEEGQDFTANINTDSLEVLPACRMETSLKSAAAGDIFQFERLGYFNVDPDSTEIKLVFNRSVSLKDSWSRLASGGKK
ncbi:MAG: glutamine--tRNA ligase [Chloroflexi bacterium GWB2_49_20]|nr:MAG: glutamine--tRNA ligase [Chloroflexi bacterium GWB2_49_20]OGN79629.1 MAG: glutamine--tRNA ligase [Chloroflexi bacterium GWC2_49_37]OGN84448.1 MAG: glutamine--tRNA ligase [Chloroflexi bacterium GWD2_49_16]HBG74132.1 glutamine--tRNA ligase [Anaerolineae bacterium]HCC78934.1 glutamine--tRNA ligase [Anaerolineae bacterium]